MNVPRCVPPLPADPPQRIVLIKPSALGDVLHALPVLSALRRRFPQARLSWLVNRAYEPLLRGHPDLDATVPFDRGRFGSDWLRSWPATIRFLTDLRARAFDLAIDLQGLLRSGLLARATGARVRLGLTSAREGASWLYTHRVDDRDPNAHAVDRYWRVAEALGAGDFDRRFMLPVPAEARAWAEERLTGLPRPWIAVGVGARWLTKRWPPTHFAELVRRAQSQFGGTAVFVGAADERPLAEEAVREVRGPAVQLAGATSLVQLAAVLASADVMLANDTGPLHLAVALGKPVVAPYTCTQARRTGPYGQLARSVETTVWCAGSLTRRCARLECMAELTPDRLWPVLQDVLQTWHRLSA